ncbi:MAG: eukaryotic-like serine/threonine-protein kinase [Verrucomicrobiota bacterium]|jgi:Tfp pilus assembly protein PilF/class 3 adenylate cyclase
MSEEEKAKLRLEIAHVLFIDIVGYSKLLINEQSEQIQKLKEIVRGTEQVRSAEAEGKLLRLPTGDGGALVFRNSPEAPVLCALEISKALKSHPELCVRMGIHSGPVNEVTDLNEQANIAGAGINLAQRVMDCGDSRHILLSKRVADDLEHYPHWQPLLHSLGECGVKHGHKVSLVNLYDDEIGNPATPLKLRKAKAVRRTRLSTVSIAALLVLLLIIGGVYYRLRQTRPLTDKDTVLLADFANSTGDPVFDATLRQGLAVQLEQSPFLGFVPDSQISQTLSLMGRSIETKLTPEIARELCQRIGSKAFIVGSIASLGTQYVVGLRAVNSRSSATIAEEQVQASAKEKVLDALSRGATKLRQKLGESLSTLQKFDTPLEQATTTSLEALQAYSLGMKSLVGRGDNAAALTFFQRAVEIDPKFANAYALLGEVYSNLAEMALAADAFQKAFSLHDKASEAERFHIDSAYYSWGSGNLEKALPIYEQWERTYPRDYGVFNNLGCILFQLGQYDRALAQEQEAVRLDPAGGIHYGNVVVGYMYLNHFDEAQAAANDAKAKGADSAYLHWLLYLLAFVKGDAAGMAEAANWCVGKPGIEDLLRYYQAGTAAYFGSLEKSREFSSRAIALADQAGQKETAAGYSADAALREALLGNPAQARQNASAALELSNGRDVQFGATLAFALSGETPEAQKLTDDLAKRFPEDTQVQFNYLPTLHAQLALVRNEPSTAVDALKIASPYELGVPNQAAFAPALYPIYIRGMAYLAAKNGPAAAGELQKILDHRGIVFNELIGALAHLGLARAYALQGDTAKACAAYDDFFDLWKNADPDLPVLKQARLEHAKLP